MRQRVLLSISSRGWAFHNIASQLQRHLGDRFDFTIEPKAEHQPADWDVAVFFYWEDPSWTENVVRARRTVVCVYDHASWTGEAHDRAVATLNRANAVIAANRRLAAELAEVGVDRPIAVCPDGVDLDLFPAQPLPKIFTVGWCGNAKVRFHDFKGLGLIREACMRAELPLVVQEIEQRVPHEEMAERFYRQISVYACASVSEGTPNPVLEALACGRPVVSTQVGLVPELRRAGAPIALVGRDPDQIASVLDLVRRAGASWAARARWSVTDFAWASAARRWSDLLEVIDGPRYDVPPPQPAPPVTAILLAPGGEMQRHLAACPSPYFAVRWWMPHLVTPELVDDIARALAVQPPNVAELRHVGAVVFRTAAARVVGFRDCANPVADIEARLRAAGWKTEEAT